MIASWGMLCRRTLGAASTTGAPRLATRLAVIAGLCAGGFAGAAFAQAANPGDIIVQREITPRIAYATVPKDQDPVSARVSTFPATTFNPTMAQVASDADLTNAHGSTGLDRNVAGGAGLQAVTRILTGNTTNNNVAINSGGIGQPAPGVGGNISASVTGALAPLSTALGGALGGLGK
ncbi:hypothetical protein BZM27_46570 [Paraburkholderia steynii]|uniref:Uncharacterized protein n=1 Tax=Paraburkholderia steynii TaxID=1245441 RepID=A0A4V6N9C7_9BURK|nr:hypothetical protein BZM27_46570 [Paraburkholderia steynii]